MKQSAALPCKLIFLKHCYMLCIAATFSFPAIAQFTLSIEVKNIPSSHSNEDIFVAGNFNAWNPGNNDYKIVKKDSSYFFELKGLAAKKYEFKFTRGGWDKVECTAAGIDRENHSIELTGDTSLVYFIAGWKDDFTPAPIKHTTSPNVRLLDSAFEIPQLKKHRRIWIYLPEGYADNKKRYPVMYMQDGQNVFDEYTSGFGEWGVDECLDSLVKMGKPGCIVVAVDNGGEARMNEYNPWEFVLKDSSRSTTFSPQGDEYVNFLAQTLKPYIDKHYRTLSSNENSIVAGSSMGGLIAYYAILKYPDVFGKAGVFSPSFWTASGIEPLTDSLSTRVKGKFFFYMGGMEGKKHVDNMIRIQEKIGKNSAAMIYSFIDPDGRHNEKAWGKWFGEFYNWIMWDPLESTCRHASLSIL